MTTARFYPIGTPGVPWGAEERVLWRARQVRSRSYQDDVVARVRRLADRSAVGANVAFEIVQYGQLNYGDDSYPLLALKSTSWKAGRPVALVTGGVHGYETSGVMGALRFAEEQAAAYTGEVNVLVAPCVSPWAYERVCRWNYNAIDPNRNFGMRRHADESSALIELLTPYLGQFLLHIDLHETTDTDASEYDPALAARDGKPHEPQVIPDGFYLVGNSETSRLDFQQAIVQAVQQVTHIAPADAAGQIIGSPVIANGVIEFPIRQVGLCAGFTGAKFSTTTEVYPDSPRTNPKECEEAQLAAVRAAFSFALAHATPG
ncbi:Succinylglutamate desuccinylase / Aspartoacylase family protein [Roseateles sp. YR242]|uniref:M14 family metallopeptidase n=1 Tax=Roseateles sp. YR242 TaxID=1855305 RepID=UPI0008CD56F0|nr:M14 family metallocarboxypeptidase [Roseateles sp. YR242]SEK58470.1 Succinylglutamate desuccinylase / Aspartoacylase family protein [Roseateles sp. YR242]